jgi:hypothetical protein
LDFGRFPWPQDRPAMGLVSWVHFHFSSVRSKLKNQRAQKHSSINSIEHELLLNLSLSEIRGPSNPIGFQSFLVSNLKSCIITPLFFLCCCCSFCSNPAVLGQRLPGGGLDELESKSRCGELLGAAGVSLCDTVGQFWWWRIGGGTFWKELSCHIETDLHTWIIHLLIFVFLTYINLTCASGGLTTNAACPVAGTAGWVVLKFKVDASGLVSTGRSINHLVLLGLDMESWLRLRGMAGMANASATPTTIKNKVPVPCWG